MEEGDPGEDVAGRQRLFDEVAGEVFERFGARHFRAVETCEVAPEQRAEGQCDRHPDHRPGGRFARADRVRAFLLEHEEIDGQQGDDQHGEGCVEAGAADRSGHRSTFGGKRWCVMRQRGWSINPFDVAARYHKAPMTGAFDGIPWSTAYAAFALRRATKPARPRPINIRLPGSGTWPLIERSSTFQPPVV